MADEDDAPRYQAEAVTCLSCEQLESAARSAAEDSGGRAQPGVYWSVSPERR